MTSRTIAFWQKLKRFWHAPLLNKAHSIGTQYYKTKGVVLYRLVFGKFGKGSYIRRPLLIFNASYISIGDRVSIRDGARIEVVRHTQERIPTLYIGDDSSIEQNVHIVCHNRIHIGSKVAISASCCILDVTHPHEDVHNPIKIVDRITNEDSSVEVGDETLIGYGAVILPNVRIGKKVVIGSNSVVTGDIPDFCVAAGIPARVLKRYEPSSGRWIRVPDLAVGERECTGLT